MDHKYPSIDNYYKSVGNMLGDNVWVTEKLDGCNFSVCLIWNRDTLSWDVEYRSRNQVANPNQGSFFYEAIQIVDGVMDKIKAYADDGLEHGQSVGLILYFEAFGKGIQKRVDYTRYTNDEVSWPVINGRTVALIDVADLYYRNGYLHREWSVWPNVVSVAKYLNFAYPEYFYFEYLNMAAIEKIVEETDIEGYVLRSESATHVLHSGYGDDLKRVKLKTNWFNSFEKNGANNKKVKPKTPPEVIEFLMERINFGRLHSVYSHGHDNLVHEMKDMRYLIDLVVEDIKAEDDSLWEKFEADIIRKTASRMLPKVLQGYFLEGSTDD